MLCLCLNLIISLEPCRFAPMRFLVPFSQGDKIGPLPWGGRRMPRGGKCKTEIPSKQEAMKRPKEALKKTKDG